MLDELIIILETKNHTVFTGKRTRNEREVSSETWEYDHEANPVRIYAAYVSEDKSYELGVLYKDIKSGCITHSSYAKKLKKLIEDGRDENYNGEKGFLLQLVKRSDGYHLNKYRVANKSFSPDFEELVLNGLMEPSADPNSDTGKIPLKGVDLTDSQKTLPINVIYELIEDN